MKTSSKAITISLTFAIISIMTAVLMLQEVFGTLFEDTDLSFSTLSLPQLPDLPIGPDLPPELGLPQLPDRPQLPNKPPLPILP